MFSRLCVKCLVNVAGFCLTTRVRSMFTTDGSSTPFYRYIRDAILHVCVSKYGLVNIFVCPLG